MSEQAPESTPDVTVEADQAVVNTAPDGGGVDNNEASEPAQPAGTPSESPEGEKSPEGDSGE